MYDVFGNMVANVEKGLSGSSWTIQDERSYDVWGSVRSGSATGGPRGRYCANLGHVQDDESGLVYMRARYYEPGSGRFISEDRGRDEENWYVYASNNPIQNVDPSGNFTLCGMSWSIVILEILISSLADIGIQLAFNGGNAAGIDWGQVAISGAVGAIGGLIGHSARLAHYARTPLGRAAWSEGAKGGFREYFLKFLGAGTGTSLKRNHFTPIFRSLLLGGGSGLLMEMYGAYQLGFLEE